MTATNLPAPEIQPPTPPAPPKKRHRLRKFLLIVLSAFVGLIVLIVIINAATAIGYAHRSIHAHVHAYAHCAVVPEHGSVARGDDRAWCLLPRSEIQQQRHQGRRGQPVRNVQQRRSGQHRNPRFQGSCRGHDLRQRHDQRGPVDRYPGSGSGRPDWTVNSTPTFAPKVVGAVGGQLLTVAAAAPASSAPAAAPTTPAAAAPTQAPTTPAAPAMTASQQQAVDAAQSYLSMGQGFSQYSLTQQLTSSYGSGFSQADAQFAIIDPQPGLERSGR